VSYQDEKITIPLLREFQDFLFSLEAGGSCLGVVTCHCAVSMADQGTDDDGNMEGPLDLRDSEETFKSFFRLTAKRGVYDVDVNSLIQHHIYGAVPFLGTTDDIVEGSGSSDQMCGRCKSKGVKKKFHQCR
jgi:hypothetical protein